MTQKTITNNLTRVFQEGDSKLLSPEAYRFITLSMGHIAHFSRAGFAHEYRDLRLLIRSLHTSEYSQEERYNLRWANELDRRGERERAATVRAVIQVAEDWQEDIGRQFGACQEQEELEAARKLAAKHGYAVVRGDGARS